MLNSLEKKIKKEAYLVLKKAYIHLWSSKGYDRMIDPPIYKIGVQDLALSQEERMVLQWIKEGREKEEIEKLAEQKGIDKKRLKEILVKLADRDKIRELLKERYGKEDEEDLDKWQIETWACKTKDGWLFFRYRVPKGQSLVDKFSFIKYRYLDTGILIKLNMAINIILLALLMIMALGYQYPIIIWYIQQIITTRDLAWLGIVIGLLYIIVSFKLNEDVLYANFLYLEEEDIELPIKIGDRVIVTKVHTVYLYQSDSIPPSHTDIFLINTERLSRILKNSLLREFLNALKENHKLNLRIEHLMEENRALRNLLDDYKRSIDEAYWLGVAVGVKQRKAREWQFGGLNIPIKEVMKYITILAIVGVIGYFISALTKSTIGLYILMAILTFIGVMVIIMFWKSTAVKTEYQIIKTVEGV